MLVPMSTFAARVGELPKDRPLLMICHLGGRSAAAAGFLIRSGRTDVVNVAGGMDAWERAGLPVAVARPTRAKATSRPRVAGRSPGGRSPPVPLSGGGTPVR